MADLGINDQDDNLGRMHRKLIGGMAYEQGY